MDPIHQLYWLAAAHFLADYPLQPDYLAVNKHPARSPAWVWSLAAHSMIHGAFVAAILGHPLFGLLEAFTHAIIDNAKCRGWFGDGARATHIDHALHLASKIVWVALAQAGLVTTYW